MGSFIMCVSVARLSPCPSRSRWAWPYGKCRAGDGRASVCSCSRARWVTLTMWQTRPWRLWCTGAHYVCESRGSRQPGADHACLANAQAQAPLCILWEARLTAAPAHCYKHQHQHPRLCAYTGRRGAECTPKRVAVKTLKQGVHEQC